MFQNKPLRKSLAVKIIKRLLRYASNDLLGDQSREFTSTKYR